MKEKIRAAAPYFIHVFTMVIWGGGSLIAKDAFGIISPARLLFFRFSIGAFLLWIFAARQARRLDRGTVLLAFATGAVSALAFALDMFGLAGTTPGKNGFLIDSSCLFVPLILLLFYREKITGRQWAGVFLSLAGLIFICLRPGDLSVSAGDVLSLFAGIFYSANIVLFAKYYRGDALLAYTAVQFTFIALFLYLFSGITEGFAVRIPAGAGAQFFAAVLYVGIFSTAFAWGLRNYVLTHLSAAQYGLLSALGPVITALMSMLFGFEEPTLPFALGACLVLAAVLFTVQKEKTR